MSDGDDITMSLKIENVYELYDDVTTRQTVTVPAPLPEDMDDLYDWADNVLYEFTGVGDDHSEGNSGYFIEITACTAMPELVGRKIEFC